MTFPGIIKPIVLAVLIVVSQLIVSSRSDAGTTETLTVAGGCFWCVEADFEKVKGVREAVSGYTGGTLKDPTYKQVSRGGSGHYEAVQITFDPAVVSRQALLDMFFRSVDPTDAGGQFCDRGNSYRTAIFVSGPDERAIAEHARDKAQAELKRPIVTPILNEARFYPAESYHQDYYKGSKLILTRRGPKTQSSAYDFYRKSCGRDARVQALWGNAAAFAGH